MVLASELVGPDSLAASIVDRLYRTQTQMEWIVSRVNIAGRKLQFFMPLIWYAWLY